MRPVAFRVLNFRSIVDSGWIPFSPDGVTIFVGQNESGKTSLLEALASGLGTTEITSDDCRTDADYPEVRVRAELDFAEISPWLDERPSSPQEIEAVRAFFDKCKNTVELFFDWELAKPGTPNEFKGYVNLFAPDLKEVLEQLSVEPAASKAKGSEENKEAPTATPASQNTAAPAPAPAAPAPAAPAPAAPAPATAAPASAPAAASTPKAPRTVETSTQEVLPLTADDVGVAVYELMPNAVLFRSESGLLPNYVDINENAQPIGDGAVAALNFLEIADIKLGDLLSRDKRARETILSRANDKISAEFNSFWTQVIGKSGKLSLKCDIDYYSQAKGSLAGSPHVAFWISDGNTQLYPKQRSQGVRWFVSFYLQLKASEKRGTRSVFLLDEPGANLHSRAQADVLKLINKLSKDTLIVYTTHSPHMIEYAKLFRVHAVQRDGEKDDSPTVVIDAHRLGTASSDTLSPVLTAMGTDLSNQQVIRKSNNVLLEEMSGFYYLTAFWKLTESKEVAHFIAATGVNKLEALANMFRGWGLDFIVAVDDDNQGRGVYNNLKKDLFGGDEVRAKAKLLKLSGCSGIEDAFSKTDFKRYVLCDKGADIQKSNSEFLKTAGRSKPVMAFEFLLSVEKGKPAFASFEEETRGRIIDIVEAIKSRLTPE